MGGTTFFDKGKGKSAQVVFDRIVSATRSEYGTRSYSGTIKEKDGFVLVELPAGLDVNAAIEMCEAASCDSGEVKPPKGVDANALARFLRTAAPIYDDKWGPALCLPVGPAASDGTREFVFCGWASC